MFSSGWKRQQPGHVAALGVARRLGQVVGLGAVDPAGGGEEQQPVVVGGRDEVLDDVVPAQRRAAHALAAALLGAVLVGAGALGVAAAGDGDDEVLVGDQVLHRQVAVGGDDLGAPVVAVLVDDLGQLVGDDLPLPRRRWRGCPRGRRSSSSSSASRSMIFCRSRAARRRSCMSRIALACSSSISSSSIRPCAGLVDVGASGGSAR